MAKLRWCLKRPGAGARTTTRLHEQKCPNGVCGLDHGDRSGDSAAPLCSRLPEFKPVPSFYDGIDRHFVYKPEPSHHSQPITSQSHSNMAAARSRDNLNETMRRNLGIRKRSPPIIAFVNWLYLARYSGP